MAHSDRGRDRRRPRRPRHEGELEGLRRTNQLQEQIQARIRQLDTQIAAAGSSPSVASLKGARSELEKQLAALVASQIAHGASVTLTGDATGPSSPVRPRPVLNLIAGVLVGLLIGALLAWLRALLDRRLHSSAEAERLLGVPTLAHIPVRRRFSGDDPVLGEAYDVLRANLAFLSYDQDLHVVTFTSFNPREGKSSTVEGLAYAAVRGGLGVLIVDGDIRTRSLSERLGHATRRGSRTSSSEWRRRPTRSSSSRRGCPCFRPVRCRRTRRACFPARGCAT